VGDIGEVSNNNFKKQSDTKLRGTDVKRIFSIKWSGKLTKWQHGRGEKS
jgi:hypothetical protein